MTEQDPYRHKWSALIGLSLLAFTAFLDYTIVMTALPFIQKSLNASVLQLQWVTNIFAMVLAMFMIIVGRFGDMFGRRKIFYLGFVVFAIAAIGAGSAPNMGVLIFFRALQGFSAAIIFTLAAALLPQTFPEAEHSKAAGIYGAITGAGMAIGPFFGGAIISLLNWRWVFYINIPIIVVGIILCSYSLREPPRPVNRVKIDWAGFILLVLSIGGIIFGIINGEQHGWTLALTFVPLLIGLVSAVLLVIVERKVQSPLLDLSVFQRPDALLSVYTCAAAGIVTYVLLFFDPLYLRIVKTYPAMDIGIILIAVPIMQVIVSAGLHQLQRWTGDIRNLLLTAIVSALVCSIIQAFYTVNTSMAVLLIGLVTMGYTWGVANAGSIVAVNRCVTHDEAGGVFGTVYTLWNLTGSITLALGTALFHAKQVAALSALKLSEEKMALVAKMLGNPEQALDVLKHAAIGQNATKLAYEFKLSFVSGLQATAWASAAVCLVITILALILIKSHGKSTA